MNRHPLDTGTAPGSLRPLLRRKEWDYFRGTQYRIEIAVDPVGILLCKVVGWSTIDDQRELVARVLSIHQEMEWAIKPWVIVQDFSQHGGADLQARLAYVDLMRSIPNLQGIAFCGVNALLKILVRMAVSLHHPIFPVLMVSDWEMAYKAAEDWLNDYHERRPLEFDPQEPQTLQVQQDVNDLNPVLEVLSEVKWDVPGNPSLQTYLLREEWRPFIDMISVVKRDLDEMNARRLQRLEELKQSMTVQESLQQRIKMALQVSRRNRENFESEYRKNRELTSQIIHKQKETLFNLGEIIETRSRETANHIRRVAEYSTLLARLSGLSDVEQQQIFHASPMHDAGKLAIPDAILNKPGKLTDEEFDIMKMHSIKGWELFQGSSREILLHAATIARQHHEKWNGRGYPDGLYGEGIHPFGRIVALADVFDALASDRCYKKAWPLEKVFELLAKEKGEHFEPILVDLFFAHQGDFLTIRERLPDVCLKT